MELIRVKVQNYKCIEDSGWVNFERITCFVGKNEAGKTAFLQALKKLNPVNTTGEYVALDEYPRKRYTRYKRRHNEDPDPVTSATYKLSDNDVKRVESQYGNGILESDRVEVTKDYKNRYHWEIDIDEGRFISHLLDDFDLPPQTKSAFENANTVDSLLDKIEESDAETGEVPQLSNQVQEIQEHGLASEIGNEVLLPELPSFLYFDEYSIMEGDVNVVQLQKRANQGNLSEADETFLALLSLANLNLEDIRGIDDYEEIIAELEAASNYISEEVFEYWTQGPNLRIEFDKSEEYPNPQGNTQNQEKQPVIHVRINNQRHQVTLPFDERSQGFVWFFSFMAFFSDIKTDDSDLVLLLDEPGLNLHAKAQHDFVRFINDRLAPNHPVAYTTHSPFMLEPKRLDRARLVMDQRGDGKEGTVISEDILKSDEDTVFPLQAVLGYDLIQTLLLGPECLLVEGKSDMVFLQVMSDILEQKGQTPLSHRWTIVPVNGADNVPTFVSLFGASDLEIGVLLDDDSRISQRLEEIEERRILDMENVKTVGDFIQDGEGDTEDLFSEEFYIKLVQEAYDRELRYDRQTPDTIDLDTIQTQHPRICTRIETFFEEWDIDGGTFHHHRPASHLQKNRSRFIEELDSGTIDRFEKLFEELNHLLSDN
jgi:AAA15 family ATPase/GTPase